MDFYLVYSLTDLAHWREEISSELKHSITEIWALFSKWQKRNQQQHVNKVAPIATLLSFVTSFLVLRSRMGMMYAVNKSSFPFLWTVLLSLLYFQMFLAAVYDNETA